MFLREGFSEKSVVLLPELESWLTNKTEFPIFARYLLIQICFSPYLFVWFFPSMSRWRLLHLLLMIRLKNLIWFLKILYWKSGNPEKQCGFNFTSKLLFCRLRGSISLIKRANGKFASVKKASFDEIFSLTLASKSWESEICRVVMFSMWISELVVLGKYSLDFIRQGLSQTFYTRGKRFVWWLCQANLYIKIWIAKIFLRLLLVISTLRLSTSISPQPKT